MSKLLKQSLDEFIAQSMARQEQEQDRLPLTLFDKDWPSGCYQGEPNNNGLVSWKPVRQSQHTQQMFKRLEEALGYKIHPDIKIWYSQYWSDPLPASCSEGDLSLLFVWNEADCERLRSNLVGHLLNKQKLKHRPTLFFACTEPDGNQFLSIDNETGEVWLEEPGKQPQRKLANSLSDFITDLTAMPIPDQQ